ncbi:hypothetical protein BHE74_00049429 [Ensete ventricosum]|nr:hypothetical protein BHE74_00049429 [Ensete ventricosum]
MRRQMTSLLPEKIEWPRAGVYSPALPEATSAQCCIFYVSRLRCFLRSVLPTYTWMPGDSSLAPEGCVGSLRHRLIDRKPERSPRAGVDF